MRMVRAFELPEQPIVDLRLPFCASLLSVKYVDGQLLLFAESADPDRWEMRRIAVVRDSVPVANLPDFVDTVVIPNEDGCTSRVVHVFDCGTSPWQTTGEETAK